MFYASYHHHISIKNKTKEIYDKCGLLEHHTFDVDTHIKDVVKVK